MIVKNNELVGTYSYFLYSSVSSKYLVLKITPSYDIDYMISNVDIIDCLIDLSFYDEKKVYNLQFGIKYYFKLIAHKDNETNLTLIMNNMDNYPFSNVTIYEFVGFFPKTSKRKVSDQNVKYTKISNELQMSIIYKTSFEYSVDIYVEIEQKCDINYIYAEVKVKILFVIPDNLYIYILIAIIPILINIIIIIIVICCCVKKCRKGNRYENDILNVEPLNHSNQNSASQHNNQQYTLHPQKNFYNSPNSISESKKDYQYYTLL